MAGSSDSSGNWRTVAPITLVTSFAVYGQFAWGLEALRQDMFVLTVVIAGGAAAAFESISLYVQWHAHDALLRKDTATAAKYRRWSYLLAGVAAAVNYSHFSAGWAPSPAAVMFALFSMSSPWLWGLHTRRAHHIQLSVEGRLDDTGALFSAERWRHFPWRTLGARRWSIDQGITDPRTAWESYRLERSRRTGRPTLEQKVALLVAVTRLASPKLRQRRDAVTPAVADTNPTKTRATAPDVDMGKARELLASGADRVVLQKELGVTEHTAKQLVKSLSVNGHQPS
jgi:hypothetical protein